MHEPALPIRPADALDADALATLVNGAYRGAGAARGWTHEADLLDGQRTDGAMLRDALARGTTILVASERGRLLGCVAIEPCREGECTIGMLTVAPDIQDRGLGRVLLAAAEERAARLGASRATMTVIHQRHSLIGWYARRGYLPTGQMAAFPDDIRFGRPLADDLHFVVLAKRLAADG